MSPVRGARRMEASGKAGWTVTSSRTIATTPAIANPRVAGSEPENKKITTRAAAATQSIAASAIVTVRIRMSLFWPLGDERVAVAFGDELAVLLERLMMEGDDACARPRFRFALGDDRRLAMHRVPFEQRVGEAHVGHAKIGDGRAHGHVRDL